MYTLIGGFCKQLFEYMINSRNLSCSISKECQNVLHRRLRTFDETSDFKRFPRDLNELSNWKKNDHYQF